MPGFMELLPQQQMVFNNMIKTIREVYELYGFRPIETPLLERSEVLLAKGSGETDKQIYRFKKGDADISLRFDLTVPLARYVANNQNDLVFPFKIGNIGKVYRGEKPQAGRFREFYQCDFDVIGREELPISYDAEIVAMIYQMFTKLELNNLKIKINNRKVLNGFFRSLSISNSQDILRIIDKIEKIGKGKVEEELKGIGVSKDTVEKILNFLNIKEDVVKKLKNLDIEDEEFKKGVEELEYVQNQVEMFEIPKEAFEIDLTIARGLDYYTGTVYETILNNYPNFGSVCSGGRYDNLTSFYTSNNYPGVGCSIGLTRLFDCLLKNNLLDIKTETDTQLLVIGMDGYENNATKLGTDLRKENINTEVMNSLKNGLKYANRLKIPIVVIIGEQEAKSNSFTVKDMNSGQQSTLKYDALLKYLRAN